MSQAMRGARTAAECHASRTHRDAGNFPIGKVFVGAERGHLEAGHRPRGRASEAGARAPAIAGGLEFSRTPIQQSLKTPTGVERGGDARHDVPDAARREASATGGSGGGVWTGEAIRSASL